MTSRQVDPLELAADAVLLASDAVADGSGEDAAHSLIHGVYGSVLAEAMQQAAANLRGYVGTSSERVASAVGEQTAEFIVGEMAALLLGAVAFSAQAISELAQVTGGSTSESVCRVLEALRV